jgi:hypothetical protein
MQSKSRHVEARSFGKGLTPTGPGNIPIETLQLLGGLHEIVTQAEISVNRFAREVMHAEDKKIVGKMRPRLLRSASATESKIIQVKKYVIQEVDRLDLGKCEKLDPTSGQTESNLVCSFMVRLDAAARKIYTLGFEMPATEIARSVQINNALKNTPVIQSNRTSNMRHVTGPDGQKIGSYGKYQKLSLTTPVQKSFREQRK